LTRQIVTAARAALGELAVWALQIGAGNTLPRQEPMRRRACLVSASTLGDPAIAVGAKDGQRTELPTLKIGARPA
jgi:hypothetical protein